MMTILLMANHKQATVTLEPTGKKINILPGQFITSRKKLAEKCGKGISEQMVRSALDFFENAEFLTKQSTDKSTNGYTLITVANWELYQDKEKNQPSNQPGNQLRVNQESTTNKNEKNEKNKKLYVETSNEYRLAKFLFEHIRKNNPEAKEPNYQSWSQQFDYIIRIDKRDLEEVKRVIAWCQKDSFWCANILSPLKLRKQYEQLEIKMKIDANKKINKSGIGEEFSAFGTKLNL
ncbi:MAG: hypothetical protein RSG52_15155 [Terrisporobacter sp.]|uniref:hypothetical protein n=1 Tax=Terrisporobacter sp. TaxID=1965305 RepID=UPI002FCCB5C5